MVPADVMLQYKQKRENLLTYMYTSWDSKYFERKDILPILLKMLFLFILGNPK